MTMQKSRDRLSKYAQLSDADVRGQFSVALTFFFAICFNIPGAGKSVCSAWRVGLRHTACTGDLQELSGGWAHNQPWAHTRSERSPGPLLWRPVRFTLSPAGSPAHSDAAVGARQKLLRARDEFWLPPGLGWIAVTGWQWVSTKVKCRMTGSRLWTSPLLKSSLASFLPMAEPGEQPPHDSLWGVILDSPTTLSPEPPPGAGGRLEPWGPWLKPKALLPDMRGLPAASGNQPPLPLSITPGPGAGLLSPGCPPHPSKILLFRTFTLVLPLVFRNSVVVATTDQIQKVPPPGLCWYSLGARPPLLPPAQFHCQHRKSNSPDCKPGGSLLSLLRNSHQRSKQFLMGSRSLENSRAWVQQCPAGGHTFCSSTRGSLWPLKFQVN